MDNGSSTFYVALNQNIKKKSNDNSNYAGSHNSFREKNRNVVKSVLTCIKPDEDVNNLSGLYTGMQYLVSKLRTKMASAKTKMVVLIVSIAIDSEIRVAVPAHHHFKLQR